MHAQTPVQIAWVIKDLVGLHHICVEVDDVGAAARDAEVVHRGVMPGGMEFAYVKQEQQQ